MTTILHCAKRWLYLIHRWMGIIGCLMFAVWFASGMVMMYVPYPELTRAERLAGLPEIAWDKVQLAPNTALAQAGLHNYPAHFNLEMMGDVPVYRIIGYDGERISLSAVDGQRITQVDATQALQIATAFTGRKATLIETLERDQWTVPQNLNPLRPLHLIALDDVEGHASGAQLYVSARNGEVVRDTTRSERAWNWVGSVPHWIYFTPLRADQPLWRQVNLWVSGVLMIVPVTGLVVGLLRIRMRRYANGLRSPYHGWQKWHHVVGLIGGVFLLTWVISGWLSVNPNRWFAERSIEAEPLLAYSGHAEASFVEGLPTITAASKEARFIWVAGQPRILLSDALSDTPAHSHLLDARTGAPVQLDTNTLFQAAQQLLPDAKLIEAQVLTEEDAYWYAHHDTKPLPVLRAIFNDEHHTWVHLDPATGTYLGQLDDSDRRQRWLFNALHQLDYLWLVQARPLWDVLVLALMLCGLVISISGVVIGMRRLRHKMLPA